MSHDFSDCYKRTYLITAVILFFVQNSVFSQITYDDGNSCTLPNGKLAKCVPLKQCEKITKIFEFYQSNSKPIPPNVTRVLQKYLCGFKRYDPMVCCPPITNQADTSPQDSTPNVDNHRNIGLVNGPYCGSFLGNRITNGQAAELSEFPWMALISYRDGSGKLDFRCAGSLISPRYVLTAAHCLQSFTKSIVGVRLGEHDIRNKTDCQEMYDELVCAPPVQDIAVEKIIWHPGYSEASKKDDVGLIKLASSADTSVDNVNTVCLPTANLRLDELTNKKVLIAGWGATETGYSSKVLLKVTLPVMEHEECKNIYSKHKITISHKQICVRGVDGKDSCKGDSGGPICYSGAIFETIRYIQYGIVSFGTRFCGEDNQPPGVYTRVASYMDWILNNMN